MQVKKAPVHSLRQHRCKSSLRLPLQFPRLCRRQSLFQHLWKFSCNHLSPLVVALRRSPIATGMKLMLSTWPKCRTSSQLVNVVGNSSLQSSRCGTRTISSSISSKCSLAVLWERSSKSMRLRRCQQPNTSAMPVKSWRTSLYSFGSTAWCTSITLPSGSWKNTWCHSLANAVS